MAPIVTIIQAAASTLTAGMVAAPTLTAAGASATTWAGVSLASTIPGALAVTGATMGAALQAKKMLTPKSPEFSSLTPDEQNRVTERSIKKEQALAIKKEANRKGRRASILTSPKGAPAAPTVRKSLMAAVPDQGVLTGSKSLLGV